MKSIFILAALLLSFQVKSQTAPLSTWQLDELSPFIYQNIEAADITLNSATKIAELNLETERGMLSFTADILYTKRSSCGAEIIVSSTRSGEEIVVTNFQNSSCPEVLNKNGLIKVQFKVFERKSLHPTTDTFFAAGFKEAGMMTVTNELLAQIKNREALAVRRLDERLKQR